MKKRLLALILAMILATSVLIGCAGKTETVGKTEAGGETSTSTGTEAKDTTEKKIKDTVTVCIASEPPGTDPAQCNKITSFTILFQIYEPLFVIENGEVKGLLAESWEELDNCTYRIHLRKDVYFHNGDKMTAEDVKYTVDRLTIVPNSSWQFNFLDVEKTVVVDEYTIDIATLTPFSAFYTYFSMSRSCIINKNWVETKGDDAVMHEACGTGPFEFVEWKNGESVTLKRFEKYWGNKPAYTNLVFKFVLEDASRALEVETGNADFAYTPATGDILRYLESDAVQVFTVPSWGGAFIYLNVEDPITKDKRVRQAIVQALDLEAITEAVYGPLATAATCGSMPAAFTDTTPMEPYGYDPDNARKLLAEAGYAEGEAELVIYSNNTTELKTLGEIMQNMWTQVGFKVTLNQLEASAATAAERERKGNVIISTGTLGADNFGMFMATFDPASATNANYGVNPRITEIIKEINTCFEASERQKLAREAQEIWYIDDLNIVMIADKTTSYLGSKNVTGFAPNPTGGPCLASVIVYE